jgi:type I restriction enzyme S subunit
MEVKPGYKQTEVGAIPDDWRVVKIKDHAAINTGKRNTQDNAAEGQYPFFVRSQVIERINSYSFDGEAVLTAGDGVGTGKVFHYINGRFDYHQRVYKISDFSPELNGLFFFLVFSTRFYERIMSMTAKSSVDSVRMEMIADMHIPLPSPSEQRAIAGALGDVDALLGALEKLIAKKRDLKQAAMQELLTGQTCLPGFTGEWEVKRLGDIGAFSKGRGIRKDEVVADGLPCVRYGEIYTHHNDYLKAFNSFITRATAKESQRILKGDLLFAGSGETAEEIGKCIAFLGHEEAYAGGDIAIFRPVGQDSKFLGYLMNHSSVTSQKACMGQGDAVVHISARNLARLELHLPAERQQTAIASVLSDMDAELAALEQRLAKTRALKQGMMQELLTGRIRLV